MDAPCLTLSAKEWADQFIKDAENQMQRLVNEAGARALDIILKARTEALFVREGEQAAKIVSDADTRANKEMDDAVAKGKRLVNDALRKALGCIAASTQDTVQ